MSGDIQVRDEAFDVWQYTVLQFLYRSNCT